MVYYGCQMHHHWITIIYQRRKYKQCVNLAINPSHDIGLSHPSRENFSDIKKSELTNDLIYLLNRLQRHTVHGKHSMRYKYKSKDPTCRFNFPQPLRQRSTKEVVIKFFKQNKKRYSLI